MNIAINKEIQIDLPKLIAGKMLLQAGSGGGKSYTIRRLLEQSFGKIQHIILDTEGEFSSLREKYDYILIGKGYDIAADPKTAALMALRLWEEGVSAIIDLYELDPEDRQKFVDNFVGAMINAPKKLWKPVLLIIDEAHEYAPENEQSKYSLSMLRLASKGRKRKIAAVFATQSIASLSKRIVASCKNKLIGYASETNDVKRAAFELGMTPQEGLVLRDLDPGEFYAFGPAISKKVIKLKVGEVKTKHEESVTATSKPAPASNKIKKALARLADLPAEIAEEANTITGIKQELTLAKRKIVELERSPKKVEGPMGVSQWMNYGEKYGYAAFFKKKISEDVSKVKDTQYFAERDEWIKHMNTLFTLIGTMGNAMTEFKKTVMRKKILPVPEVLKPMPPTPLKSVPRELPTPPVQMRTVSVPADQVIQAVGDISGPEQRILDAIAISESIGIMEPEQTAVAFLSGYTYGGGGFNNPRGALKTRGLVEYRGSRIALTDEGRSKARAAETPLTRELMREKVMAILPGPEQKLLGPLMDVYPDAMPNDRLAELSGYTNGSGGFNNPRGRLRTLGLIEYPSSGYCRARGLLFPD